MLESPLPIICGLNCSHSKVLEEILPSLPKEDEEVKSSTIYVFLDVSYVMCQKSVTESIILPGFEKQFKRFAQQFASFFLNAKSRSLLFSFDKGFSQRHKLHRIVPTKKSKPSIEILSDAEREELKELVKRLRRFVKKVFISNLPDTGAFQMVKEPEDSREYLQIDMYIIRERLLEGKVGRKKEFVEMVLETQLYTMFLTRCYSED